MAVSVERPKKLDNHFSLLRMRCSPIEYRELWGVLECHCVVRVGIEFVVDGEVVVEVNQPKLIVEL